MAVHSGARSPRARGCAPASRLLCRSPGLPLPEWPQAALGIRGTLPVCVSPGVDRAFRVHIPRVNEGVGKGVGPGQGLDLWVPLSARDGAEGGREGGGLRAGGECERGPE